jgi:O-antigen ligase
MTITHDIKYNVFNRINIFLLSVVVFLIPLNQKILSPFIGLWVLSSIVLIIVNKLKFTVNKSFITLIGFYVLLVIGLFWSDNMKAGTFDLEVKMSLVIFPFLFSFIKLTKKDIRWLLYSFLVGLMIGAVELLYYSNLLYIKTCSVESFFYINLSNKIHPSYLSYYVVTLIVVLLVDLKCQLIKMFNYKIIYVVLVGLFFCYNILLLSKIGIIVAFLAVIYFTLEWVIIKKKYGIGLLVFVLLGFTSYSSYTKSIYVKQRVDEMVLGIKADEGRFSNSSTGIRFKIWKEGLVLIKQQPILGYGTGDVKDALMTQYLKNEIEVAIEKKYNAHNQFIQVFIALGIIGFLIFLTLFFMPIKTGTKEGNLYLVCFVISSAFYMFPESVLENQAGTIFFGLFFTLLNQKSLSKL